MIDLRPSHAPKALVSYDYDQATHDLLKRRAGGQWSPQLKTWCVSYNRVTETTQALESVGYDVQHLRGKLTADLAAESLEAAAYAFMSEINTDDRKNAYKALALAQDSDAGGDSEVMSGVSDAYHQTKR